MTRQYEIRAQAGEAVQREFLGKTHTVVPLVALVEGVIQGVNAPTPEFVSAEAMAKTVQGWNGRPVVIDHPRVNGELVSANLPEVLETELVGQIFNARVDDGKLKMEAWIDNSREGVERINSTLEKVKAGEMVELSTGFFADVVQSTGKFEGEDFSALLTNIVPDHLAILSEGVGACSIADGCGANRVNEVGKECSCKGGDKDEAPTVALDKESKSLLEKVASFFSPRSNRTREDEHYALSNALEKSVGTSDWFYIFATTDEYVVYMTYKGLFQRSYKFAEDGSVTLGEDEIEVRPDTDFVPLESHKENHMSNTDKVKGLIANTATKFTEEDQQWLEGLEDEQLDRLTPNEAPKVEPAAPPSFEVLLAAAPSDIRESLDHGRKLFLNERTALIEGIKANERNEFTEEELNKFDFNTLERLAKVANVDSFVGRGVPRAHQSADDVNAAPAPMLVFETKSA